LLHTHRGLNGVLTWENAGQERAGTMKLWGVSAWRREEPFLEDLVGDRMEGETRD
jgi:hypothetical protein